MAMTRKGSVEDADQTDGNEGALGEEDNFQAVQRNLWTTCGSIYTSAESHGKSGTALFGAASWQRGVHSFNVVKTTQNKASPTPKKVTCKGEADRLVSNERRVFCFLLQQMDIDGAVPSSDQTGEASAIS